MKNLTSRQAARRAIETGEIAVGKWVTFTEGVFQVTEVYDPNHYNLVVDAKEVMFDEEDPDEYYLADDEHRWTLADLVGAEI